VDEKLILKLIFREGLRWGSCDSGQGPVAESCEHGNKPPTSIKGKAVPLQAWSGPEGSRKLGFPDYMITAQDGGKVVSPTHRPPLPPGNVPGAHLCYEAESTPGP